MPRCCQDSQLTILVCGTNAFAAEAIRLIRLIKTALTLACCVLECEVDYVSRQLEQLDFFLFVNA